MPRKALLIGAQTNGLTGVENDVAAMAEALGRRGFATTCRLDLDASRAGILDAYEKVIRDARAGDAIFLFYSGHGGNFRAVAGPDGSRGMDMQFIVPTDYAESTDDDFRGITAVELSVLLERLTRVTDNVTLALDCCHAAHMSRDPDLRVKALYHATYERVAGHLAALREAGDLDVTRRPLVSNPDAVRIVACAPEQSAYEYTNGDGVRTGMLTEALTRALTEAADLPVSWHTLIERVQRRVLTLAPNQRPEAEGPSRRLLFTVDEADPVGALPVVAAGSGAVTMQGAPLLGVQVGDEFTIMPAGAPRADEAASVGSARVDRVGPMSAHASVRLRPPSTAVPLGALAYRTRAVAPALPVRVPDTPDLLAAMRSSTMVRPADPGEVAAAEVRVGDDGGLTVCDRVGPLHAPLPAGPRRASRIVADLERLARAAALRGLLADPAYALDHRVEIGWGRVRAGLPEALATAGAVVYAGERVYVRVRNNGDKTVYASLLDIGVAAKIGVLTPFAPSGVRLDPGAEYVLGRDELDGVVVGAPVTWPDGLDPEHGRPETILVLVTSAPQDVMVLEQEGVRRDADGPLSPLSALLAQVSSGATREVGKDTGPAVRYAVHPIDFDLVPSPPPAEETVAFEIDERPPPSVRLLTARGATPRTVAVRLGELVVHRNRALLTADVRVDAVVLTGGGDPERPVFRAGTERFSNIKDGQRLPLDRMLVYHGPAVDYLDIAVWVSRDQAGSLALSDLLREQLGTQEVQAAGVQLATLMVAAPQAATAVAAAGAAAVVVNVAYTVLLKAVGSSIGLYRTSLLAHEDFGIGRHPANGHLRAQDFSFAYTVEPVD